MIIMKVFCDDNDHDDEQDGAFAYLWKKEVKMLYIIINICF